MREAIVLLAVIALMALSARAEGAEAFRAHGRGMTPAGLGSAGEADLESVSFERAVRQ